MRRSLTFDDVPPLAHSLRFFLCAPLFAVMAAAVLLTHGESALVSRWSPAALAITHFIAVGFMATTMAGALLQILPVVAGVRIVRPALAAGLTWVALTAGASLLGAAFLMSSIALFRLAGLVLMTGFAWLVTAAGAGLVARIPAGAVHIANGIRLSLAGLVLAVGLAFAMVLAIAWGMALPVDRIVHFHAAWGLVGWVAMLIIAVAFQVIPMFQATPVYPAWFEKSAPAVLAACLLAWTALSAAQNSAQRIAGQAVASCLWMFACMSLYLLHKRKRPADPTTHYWWLSLASLLACVALYLAMPVATDRLAVATAILFIVGFAMSAVTGMLYKIVPFLLWYHARSDGDDEKPLPGIRDLLPERQARFQFCLHAGALALLVLAALLPQLTRFAAAVFALSSLSLWLNLLRATRVQRRGAGSRSSFVKA